MRTFAQIPKGTQRNTPARSLKSNRACQGQSREVQTFLHSQRTTGNQLVQRSLKVEPTDREPSSASNMSGGLAHSFSGMTVDDAGSRRQVQFELKVNEPGDQYEQEADRVADQVMRAQDAPARGRASAPDISQLPGISQAMQAQAENGEVEELVQAKSADASRSADANTLVERALQGSGQSLPDSVREYMEPAFGIDFSAVRLHAGGNAAAAARAVQARAFTAGKDIVFGAGEKQLHTPAGQRLLAHELTHVVQQGGVGATIRNRLRAPSAPYPTIQRTPASANSKQPKDASDKTPAKGYELNKFVRNQAGLTKEHKKALKIYAEQIKQMLEANPAANIEIVGHGDTTGSNKANKKIGMRRAQTVKKALIKLGVPVTRIGEISSRGEEDLAVPTKDEVDNALNRRVQILTNGIAASAPGEPAPPQQDGRDVKPPEDAKPEKPPAEKSKPDKPKPDKASKDGKASQANTLLFVPSALLLPWTSELITGKDASKIQGTLLFEYMYFDPIKFKSVSGLKIFLPASLKYALAGKYKSKDQKWKLVHSTGLTIGVSVKWSPFDDIPIYLKGFGSTGIRTDFSEGYWSTEGKASVHYRPFDWLDISAGAKIGADVPLGADPDSKAAIDATPFFLQIGFPISFTP